MKSFISIALTTIFLSGCATLGSLDKSAEQMTHQAIVESEVLHSANVLSDAQFKAVNVELNKVSVAGLTFTKLLESGQATPATARAFLALVIDETNIIKATYPNASIVNTVLADLMQLQGLLSKIITKL